MQIMNRWHTWLIGRLVAVLLLATIGLQAAPSGAATFQPVQGSAFSAGTVDVALLRSVRSEVASPVHLSPPSLPPLLFLADRAVVFAQTRDAAPIVRLDFRPPSLSDVSNVPRAPRPPPIVRT